MSVTVALVTVSAKFGSPLQVVCKHLISKYTTRLIPLTPGQGRGQPFICFYPQGVLYDMKPSASPAKGKAKEETHWQSGWWDLFPLLEQTQRYVSSHLLAPHRSVHNHR